MTMTLSGDGTITGLVAGGLPNATVTADDLAAGAALNSVSDGVFFRNRIINGDMRIDQRNAGASVTPTASTYGLDRWQVIVTQASKLSFQQNAGSVTPPAGFSNYFGFTSLSAYSVVASDFFGTRQKIEGFNVADLGWGTANAKTVTLSFWVRSSLTGTFGGSLYNSDGSRSYPFTYTISSADTWEQKSITIAGDTSGTWLTTTGIGIQVGFGFGVGANFSGTAGSWAGAFYISATGATSVVGTNGATWYVTGVQLEVGSVATPFERRPYGTELALCQRYYWQPRNGVAFLQTPLFGYTDQTTTGILNVVFPTTMRSAPSFSSSGTFEVIPGAQDITSFSISTASSDVARISITGSGFTVNQFVLTRNDNDTTAFISFSAEL